MITVQAQESFERIFRESARTRLVRNPGDTCEIAPLIEVGEGATRDTRVVALTISSIAYRLLLLLHFDENAGTRGYYLDALDERPLEEVFLETCNLCCGAMNQALLRYFPDLGMSTPYVLSARCLPHLRELKPAWLASYSIVLNGEAQLAATVCVCAHAPIDFVADTSVMEETSGELELF